MNDPGKQMDDPPATPAHSSQQLPKPPPGTQRWIRYLLGFGVSVGLGVAPLLGTWSVPGFTPMLSLFPKLPWDTTGALIPISALLMGMLAVVIQFLGRDNHSDAKLRKWFFRCTWLAGGALIVLLILQPFLVVTFPVPAQNSEIAVLVGFSRPDTCTACSTGISDVQCLENTTLNPPLMRSCWGDRQLIFAYLALALPYIGLMGAFGLMVGIFMLYDEQKTRKSRKAARRPRTKS